MPAITHFGNGNEAAGQGPRGVTWIDVDIDDELEREWLSAWQEISEQTRTLLLEPVRFSRREQVAEGMFLGLRTMRGGNRDDIGDLTDLKLLIGGNRAVTARFGTVAPVDELRGYLQSGRTLVTAVDLLAFMVSGMTKRLEAVIYDLTKDTDAVEDELLDSETVPSPQILSELRRRIYRTRRHVNSVQQVLAPMATDPALALDADDRDTLMRASNHVTRYLDGLEDCRARVQMLEDQI